MSMSQIILWAIFLPLIILYIFICYIWYIKDKKNGNISFEENCKNFEKLAYKEKVHIQKICPQTSYDEIISEGITLLTKENFQLPNFIE